MILHLQLDEITFYLEIKHYSKNNYEFEWTDTDLILKSKSYLNYRNSNQEILVTCEIEKLHDKIEDLLMDRLVCDEILECLEPDLSFAFRVNNNQSNDKERYIEQDDINMQLIITPWAGVPSKNRLIIFFDRDDLEKLLYYLKLVMRLVDKSNTNIQRLIKDKIIISYISS